MLQRLLFADQHQYDGRQDESDLSERAKFCEHNPKHSWQNQTASVADRQHKTCGARTVGGRVNNRHHCGEDWATAQTKKQNPYDRLQAVADSQQE